MRKPVPQHRDKRSTMNARFASAPQVCGSNLNSVFSSDAKLLLTSTLSRWTKESSVHWVLDEDDSRTCKGQAQHKLPVSRRLASTSYAERQAPKSVWLPNVNEPVGKLTISPKFSPNRMRMPCARIGSLLFLHSGKWYNLGSTMPLWTGWQQARIRPQSVC